MAQEREFDFIKKTKGKGFMSEKDVSIRTTECSGGTVYFTFRNGVSENISPNTDCFVYAISDTRVYFKEARSVDGFLFNKNNENSKNGLCKDHRYVSLKGKTHRKLYEFLKDKNGDYEMMYDAKYNLWFVETSILFTGKNGRII